MSLDYDPDEQIFSYGEPELIAEGKALVEGIDRILKYQLIKTAVMVITIVLINRTLTRKNS